MKTTVINIRDAPKGWMHDSRYTYIGRAGAGFDGKWGNPIVLIEKFWNQSEEWDYYV